MTRTFSAKVESGVQTVTAWQRGQMTWAECLRRVDVTRQGEKALEMLSRDSNEEAVRQAVTAACGAGADEDVDECCHGKQDDCDICDEYASAPIPPRHGEEYGAYLARINPPQVETFPPDVAEVLDRAVTQLDSHRELDAEGRYVRGTFAGMTPDEVLADRERFRRATE